MILYHGSNTIVDKPEIRESNRFLDFGIGFYTTANLEQAENFAKKVVKREKYGKPIVNIYNLNDDYINVFDVLNFKEANEEWLNFVSDNRNGIVLSNNHDLICGLVADDEIYRTFLLYSNELLTKEQTLQTLKIKKLYNQYVFKNDKSLKFLHFVEAKEIQ